MAQEGSSGRRRSPVRLVRDFLFSVDERPAVSAAARAADAAIAAVATIAAVVALIIQARGSGVVSIVFVRPGFRSEQFASQPGTWPPLWILLGAALTTAPLAFRRIYPITAFWVLMAAVLDTHEYTTTVTFAAAILAGYSAVAYSPFRRAAEVSVLAAALIVTALYPNTTPPLPGRYTALLILTLTMAVGMAIRTWRRRAGESAERLRQAQAEHEAETRRAVALERARIASEMHDVVTHNVSVMVVQAGAARRVLDSSPDDARQALLAVEASGRTAMTELRHLLGLLAQSGEGEADGAVEGAGAAGTPYLAEAGGTGGAALAPQPGMARIPALLARVCAAGMPVELVVEAPDGTQRALTPGIDLAAFRVVQEALTNVMKHAGQARTMVRLEYRPRDLLITVADDGPPPDPAPAVASAPAAGPGAGPAAGTGPGPGGRGLIGLRERIAVYGGELDAGPRPGGGWRLAARIPLEPGAGDLPVPAEAQAASA